MNTSTQNNKDLKLEAHKLCGEFLGSPWNRIDLNDFEFTTVSGGLSNTLYCCALPDSIKIKDTKNTPRKVLLRIYGPIQDDPHVVVLESATFMLLSERQLGPKLYGVFPKGRLEEFIPSKSLSSDDIRKYSTLIAKEMAKIHALNVPVRKDPDLFPKYMKKWLQEVEDDTKTKYNKKFFLSDTYREEIEWMTKEMEKSHSPVVYCHNDLQGGNILLCENSPPNEEPIIKLIDFEFGGYNYRGFDIANHFCEWAFDYMTPEPPHFTLEMSKYPTKKEQTQFIRAYLDQLVLEGAIEASSVEREVENMLKEVNLFVMAPHLLWSLWSEKMKFLTSMEFSHLENGKARLALYRSFKESYLKEKSHLCNGSVEPHVQKE